MIIGPYVDLGAPGIEYVRTSLTQSPSALASLLLKEVPLNQGRTFTFTPVGVDPARLHVFDDGVFGPHGAAEVNAWVAEFVVRYLQGEIPRYLFLEDVNAQAADPGLVKSAAQFVTFDLEVYHFLAGQTVTAEAVATTIAFAKGYVTNGILTAGHSLPVLRNREHLVTPQLVQLVHGTDYILSEAYDSEGFVIWTKR